MIILRPQEHYFATRCCLKCSWERGQVQGLMAFTDATPDTGSFEVAPRTHALSASRSAGTFSIHGEARLFSSQGHFGLALSFFFLPCL